MKVGLILASAPAYSETFFYSKIKGLKSSGHEVVLFCTKNQQNFGLCSVKIFPKKHTNILKQISMLIWEYIRLTPYINAVIRFVKLERKDGVLWPKILAKVYFYAPIFKENLDWLHFGFGSLTIGAENLAASKQAKFAVSFRGFDIGVFPIKFPNCYNKLWKKVSKIHVISDDITNLLYKNGFKDEADIVKITPAINIDFFSSADSVVLDDRKPIQILTVARLHWKKGLGYTIEALALLKEMGVRFQYKIIGVGAEEEALKYDVYRCNLQNEILFLGQLEHPQIKEELTKSHLYIQYSVQEGFCNAVLEAQSMGLLCVVSDAEGLSENVMDGESGWVVPKRDPKLLANKILEIINLSTQEKKCIKQNAKTRVAQHFSIKKQQKEFVQFYTES